MWPYILRTHKLTQTFRTGGWGGSGRGERGERELIHSQLHAVAN